MTRRSPVNKRDPTGTRRIERREIARQSRIIQAYAEAMARVASGQQEGLSMAPDTDRARILERLKESMVQDLRDSTDDWIKDTSIAAAAATNRVLNNLHTGIQLGPVPVPAEEVSMLALGIRENVRTVGDELLKSVARITTEGYQEGLGAEQIARNIRDAGLTTKHNAERMVRTETMRICDVTCKAQYRAAGCDGYYSYPPSDDERLCPRCRAYATGSANAKAGAPLKVYGLDEPMALPWHPNCRCTRLPHFADDREVFTL